MTSRGRNLLFNWLVRSTPRRDRLPFRLFWHRLYAASRQWSHPVSTTVHNRTAQMGFNYTYPIFSRRFPGLNNPLVELVHQSHAAHGRPLRVVDIGAAIGDTVLLIEANCPGQVGEYVCVDGDAEFFGYLTHNLAAWTNARCIRQQLSRSRGTERALVRTHGGTASAQGALTAATQPLDDVLGEHAVGPVDVLKIDVDGFDGEVLAGATERLRTDRPAVIFEWHPILCEATGNDAFRAFTVLAEAGYRDLAWFTKFGDFSHFSGPEDRDCLDRLRNLCLRRRREEDWHYDVVALPPGSRIDIIALAELDFARHRPSRW